ncbi:hypothetical protein ACWT_3457 [Actinoplanes sp. SE50]|uniref:hypothetical protein n=1 Tax=unclassified Actinoplanes TaxID=2626549 RepID=UPI00023ED5FF|nr:MULTISPECIES: hypothetical protein [unclassified Actinoplanes]AEV84480.1 hypothetical protein ACPL_3585 [Actinoplanes sp. SE50/110]ATO82872.1 hypothetical protein ACWT_3457 [Actinoplanes sp. SE50]SLM00280.1 hypothetical protein ACSP50_3512 [Actinoplanes sp. SE50/110]
MRTRISILAVAGATMVSLVGFAGAASAAPAAATTAKPAKACSTATAAALQAAAKMPAGWKIKKSSINCWNNTLAKAEFTAPTVEQQGDGMTVFKYRTGTKKWVKITEGSSIDCADLGIKKHAAHPSWCIPA